MQLIKQNFLRKVVFLIVVLGTVCTNVFAQTTYQSPKDRHGVIFSFTLNMGKATLTGWRNSELVTNAEGIEEYRTFVDADGYLEIPRFVIDEQTNASYLVEKVGIPVRTEGEREGNRFERLMFTPNSEALLTEGCFENAQKLIDVDLTNYQGTTIPAKSFNNVSNLATVIFNRNLTSIGVNAFSGCSKLMRVDLSSTSVTTLGDRAFEGCIVATSVLLPSSLQTLGIQTFSGLYALENLNLSVTQVTSIPEQCFQYCSSLESISLHPSTTHIKSSAFNMAAITSITIPATVVEIGNAAFKDCGFLKSVTFLGTTPPTVIASSFQNTASFPFYYVPVDCSAVYKQRFTNASARTGSGTANFVSTYVRERLQMSRYGYTTYYLENENFRVPSGALAYAILGSESRSDGKNYAVKQTFQPGDAVPARTGFVLEALNGKSQEIVYEAAVSTGEVALTGASLMKASVQSQTYSGQSGKYYVLSPNPTDDTEIGFFYQKGTAGQSMTLKSRQAGLFIPAGMVAGSKVFTFGLEDETTGITSVTDQRQEQVVDIYDLQGRKVTNPKQGIYIINGKKTVIK